MVDENTIERERPVVSEGRKNLVGKILNKIQVAEHKYNDRVKGAFTRMRRNMHYAQNGASKGWIDENKYVVNVTSSIVKQKQATLYAKNPTPEAKRKEKIDYLVWDGDIDKLNEARQFIEAAKINPEITQLPIFLEKLAIVQDVENAKDRRLKLDTLARTLEILIKYYQEEQEYSFEDQMKSTVRNSIVNTVGYLKIGFQRIMEQSDQIKNQLSDAQAEIEKVQRIMADLQDDEIQESSAEAEELRVKLATLEEEFDVILREGLIFNFPKSTDIIVDPRCTDLNDFKGADWIAEILFFTKDEIKEKFKIDIASKFNANNDISDDMFLRSELFNVDNKTLISPDMVKVYQYFDKTTRLVYLLVEGYPDFLIEPESPNVELERFFPIFSLIFNNITSDNEIFPPSDVEIIRHQQDEINRERHELTMHREANRPAYVVAQGKMSDEDKEKFIARQSQEIIEMQGIQPGENIANVIQGIRFNGVDPNLYDISPINDDITRSIGVQEASLGATSGSTATEVSIAEGSRAGIVESNIDELNQFLSKIARASGQILLQELSKETVAEIAGIGAAKVWPEFSGIEISKELFLDIKAGSSGKPNQALKLSKLERVAPTLLQIPGLPAKFLAEQFLDVIDPDFDIDDIYLEGLSSIISQNQNAQASTGDAATDPNAQGAQGANNAVGPPQTGNTLNEANIPLDQINTL